jgi:carbon-monoxide dehydrogenase small subunit
VDLNRVTLLSYIEERTGGVAIGAMTRQRAAERDPLITDRVPLLAEALPWVGHTAIRNRGTIGGSLAHADPAAELRAVAVCYRLGFTGTHVGCEHGVCGACTIRLDGVTARSCLLLAVQADGAEITTVEGLAPGPDRLHPVQEAFRLEHGLQCGFCTPGLLMSATAFLRENPSPTDSAIRRVVAGHLCRCTGYQNIVKAVRRTGALLAAQAPRS